MPIAAAVISAEASQPRVVGHGVNVNWPITWRRDPMSMIITHDRHRRYSVDHGAPEQRLDRIEGGEIERRADAGRNRDRAIEGTRAEGVLRQPNLSVQGLSHRISGAAGQHRKCQHSGADDAQREDREGEAAGDRA
jgi:hypothetical protein